MSSDNIAIYVNNLSKCYQIYDTPRDRLKQFVLPRLQQIAGKKEKKYFQEFWALRDIFFEIYKGETVGIIGVNGSGKSTLLQVICGTLTPTSGSVETHGRIAALLELGSGFNPDFTGHENVYMNAAVLGLSREEVDERFDDIAAFADIGQFIEQPIKMYSSGMVVRLAFAVNIVSQPDIMVVDEALAVGDMNFQAKCMTALARIQQKGATILFVSHDVGAVKSLCSRGIYLENGSMKAIGKASDIAEMYIRDMREEMNEAAKANSRVSECFADIPQDKLTGVNRNYGLDFKTSEEYEKRINIFRYGTGEAKVTFVELLDSDGDSINIIKFNQKVKVRIFFESFTEKLISVNIHILDDKKNNITGCGFRHVDQPFVQPELNGKYMVEYSFRLFLREGNYSLGVKIVSPVIINQTSEFLDVIDDAVVFQMERWEKVRVWSKMHLFSELKIQQMKDSDA